MADITTKHYPLAPGDIPIKFKDLGGSFAQYVALEPASIAGGSGLTDTQLRASAVPVQFSVAQHVIIDAAPTTAVTGTFFQATQPVSLAANTPDVADRAARLLGHVAVDSMPSTAVTGPLTDAQLRAVAVPVSAATFPLPTGASTETTLAALKALFPAALATSGGLKVEGVAGGVAVPVSGTFFQATQPVSLATNTPDVADRAARLLGHVTVDSAPTTAITAAALPLPAGAVASTQIPASLGQKAMTASLAVALASDQGPIPTTKVAATGQTNVLKTGSLVTTAVTADQVVLTYTVTALKTFYLTHLIMYGRLTVISATASILGVISLETPSGTKAITLDDTNPTTSEVEFHPIVFSEPIPIAAGVVIRVVVTPAAATSRTWRANFGGYEK